MSNPEPKPSSLPKVLISIVIGAIIMVAGAWFSTTQHPAFQEKLAEQGIPLDLGKTIATIGVFIILFPVIDFFFLTPLRQAINERTTSLETTFSEAEQLRAEMTRMKTDYDRRLAETEAAAREQIQGQIKEAQALRSRLEAEAAARAEEMTRRASEEIESDRRRVMTELRLEVVNLTLGATEKLLGENMDTERNRKLINDFVNKVEVPS